MIRSREWGNVYIDGSELLEGALGLSWAPSDAAKRVHARFERDVQAILTKFAARSTSHAVLSELVKRWPRKVVIKPLQGTSIVPAEGASADPDELCNAEDSPTDPRGATPKGVVVGNCLAEASSAKRGELGTEQGSDAVIAITPWFFHDQGGTACGSGPGSASDELLLHEIVHALNDLSGRSQACAAAPRGFTNLEELCAITVTNVYSSETGRGLRRDHEGFRPLSADLAVPGMYYSAYQAEIDAFMAVQPGLVRLLSELEIEFNPFQFCTLPEEA